MLRWLAVLVGLCITLSGCANDVPTTVTDGHVRQWTSTFAGPGLVRLDLVFVVDAGTGPDAVRLRADAARAFEEEVFGLLGGSLWYPVDVQASIVKLGERAILSPSDDLRLAWAEEAATPEGARTFVDAVVEAWARPPASAAAANAAVDAFATMRFALALVGRPRSRRVGVIMTSRDDPAAAREPAHRYDYWDHNSPAERTSVRAFLPTHVAAYDRPDGDRWALSDALGWAAGFGSPFSLPLSGARSQTCIPSVARREDGSPACRLRVVRAYSEAGPEPSCEARRGWAPSSAPPSASRATDSPSTFPGCDAPLLGGEDGRRCRDRDDRCEGCASGWCIVDTSDRWCEGAYVRFTGGVLSAWAAVELTCNAP